MHIVKTKRAEQMVSESTFVTRWLISLILVIAALALALGASGCTTVPSLACYYCVILWP